MRGEIKFDVNDWLKEKRKQKEQNLLLLCPHAERSRQNGQPAVRNTYVQLPGTNVWQCQMCGRRTRDLYEVNENLEQWAKEPKALIARLKEIEKRGKKLRR